MPDLDIGRLTFLAVMSLFNKMLETDSGGAHELFIAACVLHGKVKQARIPRRQHIETRSLTGFHLNRGLATDIQVKLGNRVLEVFQVTGKSGVEDVQGAILNLRAHDVSRVHVLVQTDNRKESWLALLGRTEDISVLDLRQFVAVQVAELTRAFRAAALRRLYEFLDRYQPDTGRVNAYVELLEKHGLVVGEKAAGKGIAPGTDPG